MVGSYGVPESHYRKIQEATKRPERGLTVDLPASMISRVSDLALRLAKAWGHPVGYHEALTLALQACPERFP
jgi:hypothetical protein